MKTGLEIKKVYRFFTIANYEEEEQWINDMAREGWNLTAVGYCRYIFRRGVPGEFIYKIDMVERTNSDEVRDSYFNFLTECGIRIVGEWNDWLFLQKRAADGPFNIKNDSYAKLRHLNKIYSFTIRTFCRLLVGFASCVALCLFLGVVIDNPGISDFMNGVAMGMAYSVLIALVVIWVPIVKKLRRKLNKLVEDVGVNM